MQHRRMTQSGPVGKERSRSRTRTMSRSRSTGRHKLNKTIGAGVFKSAAENHEKMRSSAYGDRTAMPLKMNRKKNGALKRAWYQASRKRVREEATFKIKKEDSLTTGIGEAFAHRETSDMKEYLSVIDTKLQELESRQVARLRRPRPSTSPVIHRGTERTSLSMQAHSGRAKTAKGSSRGYSRASYGNLKPSESVQQEDAFGFPLVTLRRLRNSEPTFDESVDHFVSEYVRSKMRGPSALQLQTWWRSCRARVRFRAWLLRRYRRKEDCFIVWRMSFRYRQLCKRARVRKYWRIWKKDHNELGVVKRLIQRMMLKEGNRNSKLVSNIIFSGAGADNQQFVPQGAAGMALFERMRQEAALYTKTRAFKGWRAVVDTAHRQAYKAGIILRRVQREIRGVRSKTLWPSERAHLLLGMWQRYTRFQKHLREGKAEPPVWEDLPRMEEWDAWMARFEELQVSIFKADSLAPMVVIRRYFLRIKKYCDLVRDDRRRETAATIFAKHTLLRRLMRRWNLSARQRGRQLRQLRSIVHAWSAWASKESAIRRRAALVRQRTEDKLLGEMLVQWRWRRSAHAFVTTSGLQMLLQSRNKFALLQAILCWRDTSNDSKTDKRVMMRCWRSWMRFASHRVLWKKYLFQYRRQSARKTLGILFKRWKKLIKRGKRSENASDSDSDGASHSDSSGSSAPEIAAHIEEQQKDSRADVQVVVADGGEEKEIEECDASLGVMKQIQEKQRRKMQRRRIREERQRVARLRRADANLRGLQEGAVPEDRLDETVMRWLLVNTSEITQNDFPLNKINEHSDHQEIDEQGTTLRFRTRTPRIDALGNTALHIACARGDSVKVREILSSCSPQQVNAQNLKGDTPLHCAARHLPLMFLPIVVHLLQCGASTTIPNQDGHMPSDLATNEMICLLLRRHRKRLENFDFTAEERQWYRNRSVNTWRHVDHTLLWQEIVHLTMEKKRRLQHRQKMKSGSASHGFARPQSHRRGRSSIGTVPSMSTARMERIQKLQQAHGRGSSDSATSASNPGREGSSSARDNPVKVSPPPSSSSSSSSSSSLSSSHTSVYADSKEGHSVGWRSPRCSVNKWASRYHRALSFLRTRKALDSAGFEELLQQQGRKVLRRDRRMRRWERRDAALLSNAKLRASVAEYEQSIRQSEAIARANARIDGTLVEDSNDESSEADDEFEDEAGMENVDESDLEESGDDADEHTPTRAGKKGKRNGKGKSSRSKGKRNKARKKSDRKKGKEENAMKLQAPGGFEMDINADLEADNSMHALPSVILDSRPNTAEENAGAFSRPSTGTKLITTITTNSRSVASEHGKSMGMILRPANLELGPHAGHVDTDEDSDSGDDKGNASNSNANHARQKKGVDKDILEIIGKVDVGDMQRPDSSTSLFSLGDGSNSASSLILDDDNEDGDNEGGVEDADSESLSITITFFSNDSELQSNGSRETATSEAAGMRLMTFADVDRLRFALERIITDFGPQAPAITMGVISKPSLKKRARERKRSSDDLSAEQWFEIRIAHGIALERLEAERTHLDQQWEVAESNTHELDSTVATLSERAKELEEKQSTVNEELQKVIGHAESELGRARAALRKANDSAAAARRKVNDSLSDLKAISTEHEAVAAQLGEAKKKRSASMPKLQKKLKIIAKKASSAERQLVKLQEAAQEANLQCEKKQSLVETQQSINLQSTQVLMDELRELESDANKITSEMKDANQMKEQAVQQLQNLEMQIREVTEEHRRRHNAYTEAERAEEALGGGRPMSGGGARLRRLGRTGTPDSPPLSRGSVTALSSIRESSSPRSMLGDEAFPSSAASDMQRPKMGDTEHAESRSNADEERGGVNEGANSRGDDEGPAPLLFAPPERTKPPKSMKEWRNDAETKLRAVEGPTKMQLEAEEKRKIEKAVQENLAEMRKANDFLQLTDRKKRVIYATAYQNANLDIFKRERETEEKKLAAERLAKKLAVEDGVEETTDAPGNKQSKTKRPTLHGSAARGGGGFSVAEGDAEQMAKMARRAAARAKRMKDGRDVGSDEDDEDSDDDGSAWRKHWDENLKEKMSGEIRDDEPEAVDETTIQGNLSPVQNGSGEKDSEIENAKELSQGIGIFTVPPPVILKRKDGKGAEQRKKDASEDVQEIQIGMATGSPQNLDDGIPDISDDDLPSSDESDKEEEDENLDEAKVEWRLQRRPDEALRRVAGSSSQEELDPTKWLIGASVSLKAAASQGADPLLALAESSGKFDGLAMKKAHIISKKNEVSKPSQSQTLKTNEGTNTAEVQKIVGEEEDPSVLKQEPVPADAGSCKGKEPPQDAEEVTAQGQKDNTLVTAEKPSTTADDEAHLKKTPDLEPIAQSPAEIASSAEAKPTDSIQSTSDLKAPEHERRGHFETSVISADENFGGDIAGWSSTMSSVIETPVISLVSQPSNSVMASKSSTDTGLTNASTNVDDASIGNDDEEAPFFDRLVLQHREKKAELQRRVQEDKKYWIEDRLPDEKYRQNVAKGKWISVHPRSSAAAQQKVHSKKGKELNAHDLNTRDGTQILPLSKRYYSEPAEHPTLSLSDSFIIRSLRTPATFDNDDAFIEDSQGPRGSKDKRGESKTEVLQMLSTDARPVTASSFDSISMVGSEASSYAEERAAWDAFFNTGNMELPDDRLLEAPNSKVKRNASSVLGSLVVNGVQAKPPRPSASIIPTSSEVLRASSMSQLSYGSELGIERNCDATNASRKVYKDQHREETGDRRADDGSQVQERGESQNDATARKIMEDAAHAVLSEKRVFPATASKIQEELSLYLKAVRAEYGRVNFDNIDFEGLAQGLAELSEESFIREEKRKRQNTLHSRSRVRHMKLKKPAQLKPLTVTSLSKQREQDNASMEVTGKTGALRTRPSTTHAKSFRDTSARMLASDHESFSGTRPRSQPSKSPSRAAMFGMLPTSSTSDIAQLPVDTAYLLERRMRNVSNASGEKDLFLYGDGVEAPDDKILEGAVSELQKSRESARKAIWDIYRQRPLSMAMRAAYAELYPSLYADTAPSTSELARELQWEEAPYPTVEEKAEQIQSPSSRNDDHNGEINPGISFDLSGFPQNLQREWKAIEHERLFIKEEIEKVKEGQIEYVTSLRSQMNAEFTRKVDIIQREMGADNSSSAVKPAESRGDQWSSSDSIDETVRILEHELQDDVEQKVRERVIEDSAIFDNLRSRDAQLLRRQEGLFLEIDNLRATVATQEEEVSLGSPESNRPMEKSRIGDSKESLPTLHNGVVHGNNASLKPSDSGHGEAQDDALHLGQHLVNIDNIVGAEAVNTSRGMALDIDEPLGGADVTTAAVDGGEEEDGREKHDNEGEEEEEEANSSNSPHGTMMERESVPKVVLPGMHSDTAISVQIKRKPRAIGRSIVADDDKAPKISKNDGQQHQVRHRTVKEPGKTNDGKVLQEEQAKDSSIPEAIALAAGRTPENIPIFSSKEAAKSELRALESDLNIADDLMVDTQEKLLERHSQIIQSTDTGLHPDCGDSVPIIEKVPSAGKFKDGILAQSNEPPTIPEDDVGDDGSHTSDSPKLSMEGSPMIETAASGKDLPNDLTPSSRVSQRSVAEDDFDGSNFVPDDEDANSEHDLAESSVISTDSAIPPRLLDEQRSIEILSEASAASFQDDEALIKEGHKKRGQPTAWVPLTNENRLKQPPVKRRGSRRRSKANAKAISSRENHYQEYRRNASVGKGNLQETEEQLPLDRAPFESIGSRNRVAADTPLKKEAVAGVAKNSDASRRITERMQALARREKEIEDQKRAKMEQERLEELRKLEEFDDSDDEDGGDMAQRGVIDLHGKEADGVNRIYETKRRSKLMKDIELGKRISQLLAAKDDARMSEKGSLLSEAEGGLASMLTKYRAQRSRGGKKVEHGH